MDKADIAHEPTGQLAFSWRLLRGRHRRIGSLASAAAPANWAGKLLASVIPC
jgi:hypothetical protein